MPAGTPMMKQYMELKQRSGDCLLFFRLGDFYEMFGEDAVRVSKDLNLTLTTRDRTAPDEERVPMCGVPHHSAQSYIARLLAKGYRVAIAEQLEDPATAKGLVDRGIIRIISPGTVTESEMLDDGAANILLAVAKQEETFFAAWTDVSTLKGGSRAIYDPADLRSLMARLQPREVLLDGFFREQDAFLQFIATRLSCVYSIRHDLFSSANEFDNPAKSALFEYIKEAKLECFGNLVFDYDDDGARMTISADTVRSLELVRSVSGDYQYSLLWAIDKTKTAIGRRKLREWILSPLLSPARILKRQEAVRELLDSAVLRMELQRSLQRVSDLERLCGRVLSRRAAPNELTAIASSLEAASKIKNLLTGRASSVLSQISELDTADETAVKIRGFLTDSPPANTNTPGFIRPGISQELDALRAAQENGAARVAEYEARQREMTGLRVRVQYNRAAGYFIELPRSRGGEAPPEYRRTQTLTNSERYTTDELKLLESEILSAESRAAELELNIYAELVAELREKSEELRKLADALSELDVYCSFAHCASEYNYVCPEITLGKEIRITQGRHPVLERTSIAGGFVPNDTILTESCPVAVITGPNMAGKSTFMRQTALIVLLAQTGSFVPAKTAEIGLCDRIFTRIGASDNLAGGKSTFMVEMSEAAEILTCATERSLVILDEIGRGTSTEDGVAIARAILEFCAGTKTLCARTMFSTHYHELGGLDDEIPGVVSYAMTANKRGRDLIFSRKMIRGTAKSSYGIEVASLAGVPENVIRRSKELIEHSREKQSSVAPPEPDTEAFGDPEESFAPRQLSLENDAGERILEILRGTDVNTLSPIEALNLVWHMKESL
ncbi:MAG: DNA mismatch repair protein MutS [Oscillospiraceae bacterium]|jgi:DNA mismatch repair protein MutS|nr:DNA mismatch repair protein MutS [Oscillospiraceae bacterium]